MSLGIFYIFAIPLAKLFVQKFVFDTVSTLGIKRVTSLAVIQTLCAMEKSSQMNDYINLLLSRSNVSDPLLPGGSGRTVLGSSLLAFLLALLSALLIPHSRC